MLLSDSFYLDIYHRLLPDDVDVGYDLRRDSDIIIEMQQIESAATDAEAVKVVEWWNCWGDEASRGAADERRAALRWVKRARKMMRKEKEKQ